MRIDLMTPHGIGDELLACRLSRCYTTPDEELFKLLESIALLPGDRFDAVIDTANHYATIFREQVKPAS